MKIKFRYLVILCGLLGILIGILLVPSEKRSSTLTVYLDAGEVMLPIEEINFSLVRIDVHTMYFSMELVNPKIEIMHDKNDSTLFFFKEKNLKGKNYILLLDHPNLKGNQSYQWDLHGDKVDTLRIYDSLKELYDKKEKKKSNFKQV